MPNELSSEQKTPSKVEISSPRWQREIKRQRYQHQHGFLMTWAVQYLPKKFATP